MGINWAKKELEDEMEKNYIRQQSRAEINPTWKLYPTVKSRNYSEGEDEIEWAGRFSTNTPAKGGKDAEKFVRARVKEGHLSLGRFVIASFGIKCSLDVEKQLLRHKFLDFCIQSGRFTKFKPTFIIPPGIQQNEKKERKFKESCVKAYQDYLELLPEKPNKQDREEARKVLPLAIQTKIAVVGNLQAWHNFLTLRLKPDVQPETRLICMQIGTRLILNYEFFDEFGDEIERARIDLMKIYGKVAENLVR